ncbi:MAG: hypothetical protein KQJ78_15525 [Deltaproteobacteria bacterium]|nr:hypothetical protein [Deltaproteobacteria bacterium]
MFLFYAFLFLLPFLAGGAFFSLGGAFYYYLIWWLTLIGLLVALNQPRREGEPPEEPVAERELS